MLVEVKIAQKQISKFSLPVQLCLISIPCCIYSVRDCSLQQKNWRTERILSPPFSRKFEEELTCHFKVDMRNLTNFDPSTWKSQKIFILMCSFWAKYILFELKKYRGVIFHETEEGYKIWRAINLSIQNWLKEFDKFWPEQSKV